ncbi:hypothetical protein [Allopontixanthobacter sediminis]|uniref:Uncharacterized protein n=1 Tax=Allopontixanthobacter sediminis TaxID=1689985 RepID=A0A845B3K4_9SPHN|nr:hypothetical protein [Allopontixanthobacter sediminis]MXP44938.1 hypothetical protein [Allopontixanthobacter sediminis]
MNSERNLPVRAANSRSIRLRRASLIAASALTPAFLFSGCTQPEDRAEQEQTEAAVEATPEPLETADLPEADEIDPVETVRIADSTPNYRPIVFRPNPAFERRPRRILAHRVRTRTPPPPPPPPLEPGYTYWAGAEGPPPQVIRCFGQLGTVTFAPNSADVYQEAAAARGGAAYSSESAYSPGHNSAASLAKQVADCGPGRVSIIAVEPAGSPVGSTIGANTEADAEVQLSRARSDALRSVLDTVIDPQTAQLSQIFVTFVPANGGTPDEFSDELQVAFTPTCPVTSRIIYDETFEPQEGLPLPGPEVLSRLAMSNGLIVVAGSVAETELQPTSDPVGSEPMSSEAAVIDMIYGLSGNLQYAPELQGRAIMKRYYGPDCEELDQPGRIAVFVEPMPERYLQTNEQSAAAADPQTDVEFVSGAVVQPIPE